MKVETKCFVCFKDLESHPMGEEARPWDCVEFEGSPGFNSRFDSEQQEICLRGYEIFICDDCWAERRKYAVGYVEPYVVRTREYVSGDKIVKRFKALEEKRKKEGV